MAVKIIADTTAGLPVDFVQAHNIPILPQIVIFGEDSYRDDTELDTQMFLSKLKSSPVLPKTAAPPPALYNPYFEQYLAEGHSVLVVGPSADVSGTIRSAITAAQDFPDADVHVFDTRTVAGDFATMVILATGWAEEGLGVDEIIRRLEALIPCTRTHFLVPTLEYLHKGGRIGGAQALIGGILQVKPILTLRDGKIAPLESQRTHKRALQRLIELVLQEFPRDAQGKGDPEGYLCVMQAEAEKEAQALAEEFAVKLKLEQPVPIYLLPPAVVTHAGPGVMAVGYIAR